MSGSLTSLFLCVCQVFRFFRRLLALGLHLVEFRSGLVDLCFCFRERSFLFRDFQRQFASLIRVLAVGFFRCLKLLFCFLQGFFLRSVFLC